jgi:small ligand-binding sensory domain FIST
MPLRFASGVSNSLELDAALKTIFEQLDAGLDGASPDLAILFTTDAYADACFEISRKIRERLAPKSLIGCTGGGIIGHGEEYEDQAAISVLAGSLPGVDIHPFYLTQDDLEEIEDEDDAAGAFGVRAINEPSFFLLPDPFSLNGFALLSVLDRIYPASVKLGGMASGGFQPGSNRLYVNGNTYLAGAAGVALSGDIEILPLVSQGCRPIGSPLLVTAAEENVIQTLGNKPALEVLQEVVESLPEGDKRLAQRALLIGVVIDEYRTEFRRGDFLIRNLLGADPASGVLVINDRISAGQTVQFQIRDARTAEEDLVCLLAAIREQLAGRIPAAAAVFSCNGRGLRLYSDRNHDISLIHDSVGKIPSAGFFCAGEIGPVGGKSFIHGFTSSIGFFLPKT